MMRIYINYKESPRIKVYIKLIERFKAYISSDEHNRINSKSIIEINRHNCKN